MTNPKENKGKNKGWDNLKPCKPGEVRNPNGRPRKIKHIPDILNKLGLVKVSEDPMLPDSLKDKFAKLEGISKLEALMQLVYIYALQGKPWAVEYISSRTEGKVVQSLEVSRAPEPITIEIIPTAPVKNTKEIEAEAIDVTDVAAVGALPSGGQSE